MKRRLAVFAASFALYYIAELLGRRPVLDATGQDVRNIEYSAECNIIDPFNRNQ